MKIFRLLELHAQFSESESLAGSLGDGFLLKHNRIFRNIRLQASENGFKFTDQPWTDFQALPLSQLEVILAKKLIPYTDNVSILKKIVLELKDQVDWNDISDSYKRNFVFHESCHAVARTEALRIVKQKEGLLSLEAQRQKCLQILLEESFANTCELLAGMDAQDQAHKIFYEMSSYTTLFESRPFLKTAIVEVGGEQVVRFFILAYLHANFLKTQMNEKQFEQTLQLAGLDVEKMNLKEIKNLKMLSKIPFTLDLRFRTVTTGLHLRLSGLDCPTDQLLAFDFISEIKHDSKLKGFLQAISGKVMA